MAEKKAKGSFKLTGWHVLISVILFFGVITAVNAVMISYAVKSFPGEDQKKSYMQGLQYNKVLEEKKLQEELGWRLILKDGAELEANINEVAIEILDKDGNGLQGLTVKGELMRIITDEFDHELEFMHLGEGRYVALIKGRDTLPKGAWKVKLQAENEAQQSLKAERKIWLK